MKLENFYFPYTVFTGSSKSRASRETASEPVFEEKHKKHFEQKLKARKYKSTVKNI